MAIEAHAAVHICRMGRIGIIVLRYTTEREAHITVAIYFVYVARALSRILKICRKGEALPEASMYIVCRRQVRSHGREARYERVHPKRFPRLLGLGRSMSVSIVKQRQNLFGNHCKLTPMHEQAQTYEYVPQRIVDVYSSTNEAFQLKSYPLSLGYEYIPRPWVSTNQVYTHQMGV